MTAKDVRFQDDARTRLVHAPQNAASVAGLILATAAMVAERATEDSDAAHPGMPGMGM